MAEGKRVKSSGKSVGAGRRLRELREAAGLSQNELAKAAGVTRNAVSQWENGETLPNSSRLKRLSQLLHVPIDDMLSPSPNARERILDAARRLFIRVGVEDTTIDMICATVDISQFEFDTLFTSKDDLVFQVVHAMRDSLLSELRRLPPRYGSLSARLMYMLHMCYVHDLSYPKIVAAVPAYASRFTAEQIRKQNRQGLELQAMIVSLFEEAQSQTQIGAGNFSAAAELVLACYQAALSRAIHESYDADKIMAVIKPQITIILNGFGFHIVPGFAEKT